MKDVNKMIKDITYSALEECLKVMHIAYLKRDEDLGLTKDTHRHSYMPMEELIDRFNNGFIMYGYYDNNKLIGYISYIFIDNNIKIKDIVVLPDYQSKGIGKQLIDKVKEDALALNKDKITLRFIYENTKLKEWYEKNGFTITNIMKYDGSDTSVASMEYNVKNI